jgi:uncharacterized protein YegL
MPRLGDDMETHKVGGNFTFSGARIANLGATEYTLATAAVDVTGSLGGHEAALRDMLVAVAQSCQKSPRSDNLLLRVVLFNSVIGVSEVHGFKPLNEVDPSAYPTLTTGGMTPLYDATFNAVGATNAYGTQLNDKDFLANAVTFIVTDGLDNDSTATPKMIAAEVERAVKDEKLESHVTILIGMTSDPSAAAALDRFCQEGNLTQFIDAGGVTKGKLAKLAAFVSQSISSTSQALGTGGPSQNIATAI